MNRIEGDILDTGGIRIGSITFMNDSQIHQRNLQLVALSKCDINNDIESISKIYGDSTEYASFFKKPPTTEALISSQEMPHHLGITDNNSRGAFFYECRYKNTFCCLYNVIAVAWDDGIAYRAGLRKVHIDGLSTAMPALKRIKLR